jgi:hypothetical protein
MKTTESRKTRTSGTDNVECAVTSDPLLDEFDELVVQATRGDDRAIGAIAIALGPTLLEEARTALGELAQEADMVLEDFLLAMDHGRLRFRPGRTRAVPWMCRRIWTLAQRRRREQQRDWGIETEHE